MPDHPTNDPGVSLSRPQGPPAGHALPGAPESADVRFVTGAHPAPAAADTDPDTARRRIVETRERMSGTIDQIEEQLLRRKERLQEQLDVRGQIRARMAPARERIEEQPLLVFGGVFAAALALGYLTGGRDHDDREMEEPMAGGRGWHGRSRRWERRSRDLLRQNRALEAELRSLRSRLDEHLGEEAGRWVGAGIAGAMGSWFNREARDERLVELDEHDLPGEYHPSASYDQFAQGQRTREPGDPLQG